jgi:hypothetical protein
MDSGPAMSAEQVALGPAPPQRSEQVPAAVDAHATAATLGLTFGTRFGFPTGVLSPELELRGDVHFRRWLVSLSARGAPTGTNMAGTDGRSAEYTEFSFGALAGRWFELGGGTLAVTAGPRAGTVIEETETTTRKRRDLWVQTAARYVMPFGDRWRPALGLELEAAPARLFSAATAAVEGFPSWSASIRFGVVGSVP